MAARQIPAIVLRMHWFIYVFQESRLQTVCLSECCMSMSFPDWCKAYAPWVGGKTKNHVMVCQQWGQMSSEPWKLPEESELSERNIFGCVRNLPLIAINQLVELLLFSQVQLSTARRLMNDRWMQSSVHLDWIYSAPPSWSLTSQIISLNAHGFWQQLHTSICRKPSSFVGNGFNNKHLIC